MTSSYIVAYTSPATDTRPARSDIYRGGRRIGEIATIADDGAPEGPLYSVLLMTDPIARFRVSPPSELLPRVVEHVNSNPCFV